MIRRIDTLHLAVGLAHAVPGAELVLRSRNGHQLTVGSDDTADINICCLRRVLMASACPIHPDPGNWVEAVALQGSLRSRGGGIHRNISGSREERWFACALRPEAVFERLEQLDLGGLPTDAVEIVLKPDPGLGLTNVCVMIDAVSDERHIDKLAVVAHSACLVEELLSDTRASADLSLSRRRRRPDEPSTHRADDHGR